MEKKRRTIKKRRIRKAKSLKGGKYLGEGSYGCVVYPAIPCSKTLKSNSKSVSKLLIAPTDADKDEISISNKLKQIDPEQKHFITFEDACRIKNIPTNRSNTVSVEFEDESLKSYDILNSKRYDKHYCPLDLRLKPINLIMPYGGYDLINIIKNKSKDENISLTGKILINNFKALFKNLLVGIKKMHDARLVNRDIKSENIMSDYNSNLITLRYIDFGLSNILTPEFCTTTRNIDIRGTAGFISPDLYIAFYINDKKNFDYIYKVLKKDVKDVLDRYKQSSLTMNFYKDVRILYDILKNEYISREILDSFFGTMKNKFGGYMQKGDIYALGITMLEFLINYQNKYKVNKLNDKMLFDLLQKMVQLNPDIRYDVNQCLNHPYFATN